MVIEGPDGEVSIMITTPENVNYLAPIRSRRNSSNDDETDFKDLVVSFYLFLKTVIN